MLAAVLALYETQREDLPRWPALFVLVAAGLIVRLALLVSSRAQGHVTATAREPFR